MKARFAAVLLATLASVAMPAGAKVVRVDAGLPVPMAPVAGRAAYERIDGLFYGEIDPKAPANAIITDLALAPRNARGMVGYSASFAIARPVDPARSSGVLYYDVANRGGGVSLEPDEDGHIRVVSGWQGDIEIGPRAFYAVVPVAHNPDGSSITGPILARLVNLPAGAHSAAIFGGFARPTRLAEPVSLDTANANLVIERDRRADEPVPPSDWAFGDCRTAPFPGTPDPARVCLKAGFDPDAAYRLTYQGKDPKVLGIGFAATRDLIAYLRDHPDATGSAIRWAVGVGNSQSGNFLRSFVHLGFNADEAGRRVFDGINPNIAARQIVLNQRFGIPGGAAQMWEPGSEGTLWWGRYTDSARHHDTSSLLDRCNRTATCPKVIETFGSAEIWNLRMSPDLIGTDARADIPLPANVRRYYVAGITHGGSWVGGFPAMGESVPPGCMLPGDPASEREILRVARKRLVDWVTGKRLPPPSRYPTLARSDLVEPTAKAMGWPAIPKAPRPDGKQNPLADYDFGSGFITADVSGVATRQPPILRQLLPQRVPRVNADGNEATGVLPIQLQVPTGTFTGWNVTAKGYGAGGGCSLFGGYIPFARTTAERLTSGDPRPSLEERYRDHSGFVASVKAATARSQADGWLLSDDAARLVAVAEKSDVLR
jgi:hypothetical protein